MTTTVGILGIGADGGTFLDWTLHYLTNDTSYHQISVNRWSTTSRIALELVYPIVSNPLTANGTAHFHIKTHPTQHSIDRCVELLRNVNSYSINSFYAVNTAVGKCVPYDVFVQKYPDVKFIRFVILQDMLYELFYKQSTKMNDGWVDYSDVANKSAWDKRLHATTHIIPKIAKKIEHDKVSEFNNQYCLSLKTMQYNLDTEIEKIFEWLNIEINLKRYDHWKQVHAEWQRFNPGTFFNSLEHIINCIQNNINHDLSQYKMDLFNESIIIHKLNSLNIEVAHDSIETMPLCTSDWHNLIK